MRSEFVSAKPQLPHMWDEERPYRPRALAEHKNYRAFY